ncbi:MAG: MmcQ/YjbR family DNA-binding protein [Firmicutes bacterium]|nr:MmcQ/YjbR family DNA-binding protein [Bacillota bacterium]
MKYPWLDEYLLSKKAVQKDFKEEWQWERYQIGEKLFAAICYDKNGNQILTVKCEPEFGEFLREKYREITPGYYMNKVHWNSVDLNGNVPAEIIKEMIDQSYKLVLGSFSKKRQRELLHEEG